MKGDPGRRVRIGQKEKGTRKTRKKDDEKRR